MGEAKICCVTGADGFLGRHVVRALGREPGLRLRALRREATGNGDHVGDLHDASSLQGFLDGAELLVNLVHPADAPGGHSRSRAIRNLAVAARAAGVRRVLHVSSATVVGRCPDKLITEQTPCRPRTDYEASKLEVERLLAEALGAEVDVGILRPTAIVGEGSANLRKLAFTILNGPAWRRHLLRLLHGRRRLHLVAVERVAAAAIFLALDAQPLRGEAFIVCNDDDPLDDYQAVDARLGQLLGKPLPARGPVAPERLLRLLLRLRGQSLCDPRQRFSSGKLEARGFRHEGTLDEAVAAFARGIALEKATTEGPSSEASTAERTGAS